MSARSFSPSAPNADVSHARHLGTRRRRGCPTRTVRGDHPSVRLGFALLRPRDRPPTSARPTNRDAVARGRAGAQLRVLDDPRATRAGLAHWLDGCVADGRTGLHWVDGVSRRRIGRGGDVGGRHRTSVRRPACVGDDRAVEVVHTRGRARGFVGARSGFVAFFVRLRGDGRRVDGALCLDGVLARRGIGDRARGIGRGRPTRDERKNQEREQPARSRHPVMEALGSHASSVFETTSGGERRRVTRRGAIRRLDFNPSREPDVWCAFAEDRASRPTSAPARVLGTRPSPRPSRALRGRTAR